jgi:hypothetical protein
MSSVAALSFILVGSGLLILASQHGALRPVGEVVTYAAALIGFVALAGYLYGAPSLHRAPAPPTPWRCIRPPSLLFWPSHYRARHRYAAWRRFSWADGVGAILARRLLPVAVFAPPLVGYLRLVGQQWGLYGTDLGLAPLATSTVLIFAVVIYGAAASMRDADVERRDSELAPRMTEHRFGRIINNAEDFE